MKGMIPGTHIYWSEYTCNHCGKLPPDFYNEDGEISIEYVMLFRIFEFVREGIGKPLKITRGYSCTDHQIYLYLHAIRKKYHNLNGEKIIQIGNDPTITPYSAHIFGLGLDVLPKNKEDREKVIGLLKQAKPLPRIGHKAYENNKYPHIHFDIAYMMTPRYSKKLRKGAKW